MKKPDSEIQREVLDELARNTRLRAAEVGVSVDRGIVTLSGTVTSWAKHQAAQDTAHRVGGVRDVANALRVRPPGSGRTDADIARAVRDALEWDVFVPETRIRSTIANGQVLLEGEVDDWNQRDDAERAVRNLAGVASVVNRIAIAAPQVPPSELRQAVQTALSKQAQREAQRVQLDVKDGHVIVNGVVHSWNEREAVVGAVRGTSGVRSVESRLRVEP